MILLCLATAAGAATAAPERASTGVLAARIDAFLADYDLSAGRMGIVLRDGATGRVLYARDADRPLKPASNAKILTTAAALHHLGATFRYRTPLAIRGERDGDTLQGDIVVVGSGDPSISGRFTENHDRQAIFRQWADALKAAGIRRVAGDVVGIDDAFDDMAQAPGWPAEDRGEWYCAEISALAFNDSCVDLRWRPARGGKGGPAVYELVPPTSYVRIVNFVTSAPDPGPYERFYSREAGRNVITVRGRVGRNEEAYDSATVSNPTLYFVTVLAETLRASGIRVDGRPRDIDEIVDKSVFHQSLEPLTYYESPMLRDLVQVVNSNSHNFYAEQILKTLGKRVAGEGSFAAGVGVVRDFLTSSGIAAQGFVMADGSGLSRLNRLTPAQIAAVLLAMERSPYAAIFRDTLPQGGRTGSLRRRFVAESRLRETGPRVRAKTGFIRNCHALSGWVETRAGQPVCFSILCNDLPMTDQKTKLLLERMVALVAECSEKM